MKKRWNLRVYNTITALEELQLLILEYENKILHGCSGCKYSQNCSMCLVSANCVDGEFFVPDGYCNSVKK